MHHSASPPAPGISIDGSMGEGGGQVLRMSVALAALLSRSLRVRDIRAARPVPGLRAQHLAGVTAVAAIAGASLSGAAVGSRELTMTMPTDPDCCVADREKEPLFVPTETAGSCALVLQAALPVALKYRNCGPALVLTGGTIAMAAPHADYVQHVLCPNLKHFGIELTYAVERHGFFPRGGARVNVSFSKYHGEGDSDTTTLKPINWMSRGDIRSVCGRVTVAGKVSDEVGVAMAAAARKHIRKRLRQRQLYEGDITITMDRLAKEVCMGDCGAITLWASVDALSDGGMSQTTVLGASGLMDRKSLPGVIAETAADELCDSIESGSCVDSHMADQVVMYDDFCLCAFCLCAP
jgi:RNA 3'-terminal phosphate cyclase (ATP)